MNCTSLMIVKHAIELKDKYFTGDQYSTTKPYYVGNPGDVLVTMSNGSQCFMAKNAYLELVAIGLAPAVHQATNEVKFN